MMCDNIQRVLIRKSKVKTSCNKPGSQKLEDPKWKHHPHHLVLSSTKYNSLGYIAMKEQQCFIRIQIDNEKIRARFVPFHDIRQRI